MEKRITTQHPAGKKGVNIELTKYNYMKDAILTILEEVEEISFQDLNKTITTRLDGKFDGSISWYYTTVKLDLEARGLIERTTTSSPQMIRKKTKT